MARFKFGRLQKRCMNDIAKGQKIAAVARKYGVHRCSIHRWMQREEVIKYLEMQRAIEAAKALRELDSMLDSPNPWVSLYASEKILDMCMPKPEVKITFV